ncbi:MAG TPA: hypothetical protein VIH78_11770 [Terriglobales bacterium]
MAIQCVNCIEERSEMVDLVNGLCPKCGADHKEIVRVYDLIAKNNAANRERAAAMPKEVKVVPLSVYAYDTGQGVAVSFGSKLALYTADGVFIRDLSRQEALALITREQVFRALPRGEDR